jgi:hypothetical protein
MPVSPVQDGSFEKFFRPGYVDTRIVTNMSITNDHVQKLWH